MPEETKMIMLYMDADTHEESLVEVELLPAGKYREGMMAYRALGKLEKTTAGWRELGVRIDQNVCLEGGAGCGLILTDVQAQICRELTAAAGARRQAGNAAIAKMPAAAENSCWECGRPWPRGARSCPSCGEDHRL